jgi:PAT family beta-lactamase induction signal transducer AmpG
MAFASATHDIAADGFYMLALPEHHQSAFVGVRNTFYRLAMIAGQGGIVVLAGSIEQWSGGNLAVAWSSAIAVLALLFPLFALYHKFLLPVPASDLPALGRTSGGLLQEFFRTFSLFFKKKDIIVILAFLLFYRFAEAQLVKLVPPFLLDVREKGGLGLSTSEVGVVYGTVGIVALTLGGLVGGYVVSRNGLKRWLWIMVLAIHLPDAVFVYLSQMQPEHFLVITSAVAIEQFGYGFGFTAYVLFMMMISAGEYRTAHYAICTGFMALGMMVPGMFSGFIQEGLGYKTFFLWILLSTIPGFIVAALVKIEPGYGMKREKEQL